MFSFTQARASISDPEGVCGAFLTEPYWVEMADQWPHWVNPAHIPIEEDTSSPILPHPERVEPGLPCFFSEILDGEAGHSTYVVGFVGQ